jgi:hypothetical protein
VPYTNLLRPVIVNNRTVLAKCYMVFTLDLCDEMNVLYVYLAYICFSPNVPVARVHGLVAIVLGLCIFHYVRFKCVGRSVHHVTLRHRYI